jgi:hypothetical protein
MKTHGLYSDDWCETQLTVETERNDEKTTYLCGSQEERWDLVDDDAPAQDCMVCVELRKAHAPCPSCGGLM